MTIYSSAFYQYLDQLHSQKKTIVLVTGVFDVFHIEHLNFLSKARKLGDALLVGVESDVRVREIKGENRPLWSQDKRKKTIEQLKLVDLVFILPEQFSLEEHHWRLIRTIKPQYIAVSSHSPHLDQKKKLIEKIGGKVIIVHQQNPAISTTALLQKNSLSTT